jgi:hypothetical protein
MASDESVSRYLTDDHARLADLLDCATAGTGAVDLHAFREFRRGLLRHIGIEEKILLPAAAAARGGVPLAIASKLRLDHGALAALLVPMPTMAIVRALRMILERHNALEEGPGGLYAECDEMMGVRAAAILAELRAAAEVRVAEHQDGPLVMPAVRRAVLRAGYDPVLLGIAA